MRKKKQDHYFLFLCESVQYHMYAHCTALHHFHCKKLTKQKKILLAFISQRTILGQMFRLGTGTNERSFCFLLQQLAQASESSATVMVMSLYPLLQAYAA